MFKFRITIDGRSYAGMFAHSCDAVADAIDRFPGARRIVVRAC